MSGPVKKFWAGSMSCALWDNKATVNGRTVSMLKATIDRRYKDNDGNWKSSNSLGRRDIPDAISGLVNAFVAMTEERSEEDES